MIQNTKGIVLRSVKYGESSLVLTIYTELFGLQSYLVNGVRSNKKTGQKASLYQPANLLDLVVYHHPNKNLQRIKEARIAEGMLLSSGNVIRNMIATYMVELILKAITETETNSEWFHFFEDSFRTVQQKSLRSLANYPVAFTLLFADHLGFAVQNNYSTDTEWFDLQNGMFRAESDRNIFHPVSVENSQLISKILSDTTTDLAINGNKRLELLNICIDYLRLHIPHLGELRSVPVLHELLNG